MSNTFVEFAGKKEYKCPKCKATIRYAKYFGSDGKLLTTDGKEPYFDKDRKPMSNTGWPTDEMTKQMHECNSKLEPLEVNVVNKSLIITPEGELDHIPQTKESNYSSDITITHEGGKILQTRELNFEDMVMERRKGEVLTECAILYKEEEWITDYLLSKGGGNPNPAKVGMWHKMIDERLRRVHEAD